METESAFHFYTSVKLFYLTEVKNYSIIATERKNLYEKKVL